MPRKKKFPLPSQGDAFAVPLADGRYSVCRVILDNDSEAARRTKSSNVLVACSQWVGSEIPKADDPSLLPILCLTHHAWKGKPEILWISEPVPETFIPIGRIPPAESELSIVCNAFGGWGSMTVQPLLQWRWDNDRDAVLAEDAEKLVRESDDRRKAALQRQDYLSQLTLNDLTTHQFFPNWDEYHSKRATRTARHIMQTTVRSLIELGESASEEDRMSLLQSCIESFNEFNTDVEFIDTVIREAICEEFELIVHACGLGQHENLADEWRNW